MSNPSTTQGGVTFAGGATPCAATFSNPASGGAYSAGYSISNSATAAACLPLIFPLTRSSGRLTGCRAVVTPASSNLVITALDFDLLIFKPATSIPFAAGSYPADNGAMAITAAAFGEIVGVFRFSSAAWRNPAGALTAGVTGYQAVTSYSGRPFEPFNVTGYASMNLLGVVQALGAWTPGAVINQFNFKLDLDSD